MARRAGGLAWSGYIPDIENLEKVPALRPFKRSQRVQHEIRRILAEAIEFDVRDPRLENVTILSVELSADLRRAKVYFSTLKDPDRALAALNHAKGYLRSLLASQLYIKFVPEITFELKDISAQLQE